MWRSRESGLVRYYVPNGRKDRVAKVTPSDLESEVRVYDVQGRRRKPPRTVAEVHVYTCGDVVARVSWKD